MIYVMEFLGRVEVDARSYDEASTQFWRDIGNVMMENRVSLDSLAIHEKCEYDYERERKKRKSAERAALQVVAQVEGAER